MMLWMIVAVVAPIILLLGLLLYQGGFGLALGGVAMLLAYFLVTGFVGSRSDLTAKEKRKLRQEQARLDRAKAADSAPLINASFADVVKRKQDSLPGLMTAYLRTHKPPEGVALFPASEVEKLFLRLYHPALAARLIEERYFDDIVEDDFIAAFGVDRGLDLFWDIAKQKRSENMDLEEPASPRNTADGRSAESKPYADGRPARIWDTPRYRPDQG